MKYAWLLLFRDLLQALQGEPSSSGFFTERFLISASTVPHCVSSRRLLVSWCFEPSQPLGVTSGLNTNSNLYLSYFAHKSFDTGTIFLQYNYFTHAHTHTHTHTYTHTHMNTHTHTPTHTHARPPQKKKKTKQKNCNIFLLNLNASTSQLKYFSTRNSLTYQSLSGCQKLSPDSHFETVNTEIPLKRSLCNLH